MSVLCIDLQVTNNILKDLTYMFHGYVLVSVENSLPNLSILILAFGVLVLRYKDDEKKFISHKSDKHKYAASCTDSCRICAKTLFIHVFFGFEFLTFDF